MSPASVCYTIYGQLRDAHERVSGKRTTGKGHRKTPPCQMQAYKKTCSRAILMVIASSMFVLCCSSAFSLRIWHSLSRWPRLRSACCRLSVAIRSGNANEQHVYQTVTGSDLMSGSPKASSANDAQAGGFHRVLPPILNTRTFLSVVRAHVRVGATVSIREQKHSNVCVKAPFVKVVFSCGGPQFEWFVQMA